MADGKAQVTMGEESESEDEVEAPSAPAQPAAVTMGEEDESDEEEDEEAPGDFTALTDRTFTTESGETEEDFDGTASSPTSSTDETPRYRPGYVTWRHKTLRTKNRKLRRNLMGRVCAQPKMVSSKLHDLDGMLSRQQTAAQDVSDLLQVLRVDMATLHEKLALMLSNSEFVPKLHLPCCSIRDLSLAEAKERLSSLSFPKVETKWIGNTFCLRYGAPAPSTLHYKLEPEEGENGESQIAVIETLRDVANLHSHFMAKLRGQLLDRMMTLEQNPQARTALVVVDVQNDFITGALKVGGAQEIIAPINALRQVHKFDIVVLTKDSHPPDHCSFVENNPGHKVFETIELPAPQGTTTQILWPTHCVTGSEGEALHAELVVDGTEHIECKGGAQDVDSYSAFFDNAHRTTGLGETLHEKLITHVFVCGLAFDYCAGATACDAAELGFTTYLLHDLCRSVSAGSKATMQASLDAAKVSVIDSAEVPSVLGELLKSRSETIVPGLPERTKSPLTTAHYEHLSVGYQSTGDS